MSKFKLSHFFVAIGLGANRLKGNISGKLFAERMFQLLTNMAQKNKFSIKDFFSKYDQIRRKLRISSYLPEEIVNGKLHFLCSENLVKQAMFTTHFDFVLIFIF